MSNGERVSQSDALVDDLKDYFLSDDIRIGDKLPTEKKLCEMFHVGRSTVREAVRTLQVMGYIDLRPGRGAFLAAKSLNRVDTTLIAWVAEHKPGLEETLRVRLSLETLAVRFAVEKGSDAELARIDFARLAFEDALMKKDYLALPSLDEAFHRAIVHAGHSELLATLNSVLVIAFREWRDRSLRHEDHAAQPIVPHQRIAAAILARDSELAEMQMRRHLEQVMGDMFEGIKVGARE